MTRLDKLLGDAAFNIVDENGVDATIKSTLTSTFAPSTGAVSKSATSKSVKVSPPSRWSQSYSGNMTPSDVLLTILPSRYGVTPKRNDILKIDGVEYTIVSVMPLRSGQQIAAFELEVKA